MTYDRIGSAGTAGGERDLYYWMDKIGEEKKSLAKYQSIIHEFQKFMGTLDDELKIILREMLVGKRTSGSNGGERVSFRRGAIWRGWEKFTEKD